MKNVTRLADTGFPLALLLILAGEAWSKPRPPLPPLPERSTFFLRCDQTNWWGDLRPAPLVFDNIQLVESWSGYALYPSTKQASRLQYRLVEKDAQTSRARTNLNVAVGSMRLWFSPTDWSSASLGGTGPGLFGRLIEVGTWTQDARYGWWSLYFADDGDSIHFSAQAKGEQADYLKAPIQLKAGAWHLITLTYGPKFCAFYLDGELVAQGDGVTVLPDAKVQQAHGFCIGTDLLGGNAAGGALDEITIFDRQLSAEEIAHYYTNTRPIADLGPVTEAEEQQRLAQWAALKDARASGAGGQMLLGMEGFAQTGLRLLPPVFETTNGTTNLWLTIAGGEPGARYDLFSTTNLLSPSSNTLWNLQVSGTNGQALALSSPPMSIGVYQLGTQLDTDYDGLTDAYEGLVNKSDPNVWDLPANGDWDNDGSPNYMDARPTDSSVTNALRIRILKPPNGAVIR
jgi:hypothetical protein